jgi:hypothetical protein
VRKSSLPVMGGMVDLMDGSFPGPIAPVEFQITDTERGIVKLLVGNIDLVGLQYSVVTQCCAGHRKMAFSEMKKSAKTENAICHLPRYLIDHQPPYDADLLTAGTAAVPSIRSLAIRL